MKGEEGLCHDDDTDQLRRNKEGKTRNQEGIGEEYRRCREI